jgi:radical SAM protein with 4Fe4S-binding SPASM domain
MQLGSYGSFSRQLHGQVGKQRLPLNGTIELTRRCNLTCSHCYNNLPTGDRQARATELTLAEHERLLDQLVEAGCLWLLYTGGEIFVRPDFMEIYLAAKNRGFLITLFTNGTMITPEIVEQLRTYPPFALEITLYGHTAETYEALTGVRGSYSRCLRGIELVRKAGLPLRLKTVAVSINKHEVLAMRDMAEKELGVPFKFDAIMNPRVDCSQSPLAVRLSPEEVVWFDLDERRRAEWVEFARTFQRAPDNPDEIYTCGGGVGSFAIDPQGRLTLCVLSQQESYDLRTGSFQEGWDHFLGRVRHKPATRVTKCTHCHLKSMCGMCPANAELHSGGDPELPVPFLCETAHLRAQVFGLPVPDHGDCEFCLPGADRTRLLEAAARLQTGGPPSSQTPTAGATGPRRLPIVTERPPPPAGGGCHC